MRKGEFMYLHIGKNYLIPQENIVGIVDVGALEQSDINREFFETAYEEGLVTYVADEDDLRSYIITENVNNKRDTKGQMKTMIYGSSISASTLLKRSAKVESETE